ncbi:hypothetical protein GCM10010302_17730 [Streptomyces polychromogenes]|uniref:DUF317 domain-containing protein n=1 Tax=Streptomyces polychromogenes TaxID=67342 RepID=A0ABN0V861_9ACTN
MLTETTGRTPQGLAAELAGLKAVDDWPSVWSGPPQGGSGAFNEWCGRYGWQPQTFDRQLLVETRSGGRWTFYDRIGGEWSPLVSLTHYPWQVKAGSAAENNEVLTTAAAVWPAHLEAAVGVLGAPTWTGPWDAPDFPEPPHPSYWHSREARMRSRRPYRFAYWAPGGDVPGTPFIVLSQSVAFPTWTTDMAGASAIVLDVYAPEEFQGSGR